MLLKTVKGTSYIYWCIIKMIIHVFTGFLGTNGSCSCGSEWSDAEFLEDVPVFIETDVLSARGIFYCLLCKLFKK